MKTMQLTIGCDTRICLGIPKDSRARHERFQDGWVDIHSQCWDGNNHETHDVVVSTMIRNGVIQRDIRTPS
jgi:hypothetical protein